MEKNKEKRQNDALEQLYPYSLEIEHLKLKIKESVQTDYDKEKIEYRNKRKLTSV